MFSGVIWLISSKIFMNVSVHFLNGTVRFLHGTVRFMNGTVRFLHGTVRFLHGIVRFMNGTVRFLHGTVQRCRGVVARCRVCSYLKCCWLTQVKTGTKFAASFEKHFPNVVSFPLSLSDHDHACACGFADFLVICIWWNQIRLLFAKNVMF